MRRLHLPWICLFLLAIPRVHAQTTPTPQTAPTPKEAFAALYTAVDQYMERKTRQLFTYTFLMRDTFISSKGKVYGHRERKFDVIYLSDRPYVRLLEKDGKPLTGKDAREEQERYDKAVKDSTGMSMGQWIQQHHGHAYGYYLPIAHIKTKFATQYLGVEQNGEAQLLKFHLQTVSNAMDEPDAVTPQEITLWVDSGTKSLVKSEFKLWAASEDLFTGSSGAMEFFLVDGSLCAKHSANHFLLRNQAQSGLDFETTYSDYKRFTSTAKILTDPVQ